MMNSHQSMQIAMDALGAHPTVLAFVVAGIAVLIATAFAIEKRAERSRN
jgi:hypothetical protein